MSGGQCHLRRFSWPSLAYMCTKAARFISFHFIASHNKTLYTILVNLVSLHFIIFSQYLAVHSIQYYLQCYILNAEIAYNMVNKRVQ